MVSRSFGFDTAVEVATEAIHAAHTEAVGSPNGIGLVKLMGRFSGFIAATATLALREVNYVLIPEADFDLDGECGLFANLEWRLSSGATPSSWWPKAPGNGISPRRTAA